MGEMSRLISIDRQQISCDETWKKKNKHRIYKNLQKSLNYFQIFFYFHLNVKQRILDESENLVERFLAESFSFQHEKEKVESEKELTRKKRIKG